MSRWVWCISIVILLAIGAAIGFGWYFTHDDPNSLPVAVGGSDNQAATMTSSETTQEAVNTSRTLIAPPAIETKRALPERDVYAPKIGLGPRIKRTNHYLRHRKNRLPGIEALD